MERKPVTKSSETETLDGLVQDVERALKWEKEKSGVRDLFHEFAADVDQQLEELPPSQREQIESQGVQSMDLLRAVTQEIYEKDEELIQEDRKDRKERLKELTARPDIRISCDHCHSDISLDEQYLLCLECVNSSDESEAELKIGSAFGLCFKCYVQGAEHEHKAFTVFRFSGGMPRLIFTDLDQFEYQAQAESFGIDKLALKTYRDSAQVKNQPLSQILNRYLRVVNIADHGFGGNIRDLRSIIGTVTKKISFHTLKNWAIACYLLADHDFFQRTKMPAFRTILSPMQRASFGLLKEWWLSEIQDSKLMQQTISGLIVDCLVPETKMFAYWVEERRNRYDSDYHGALLKLFHAEFDTLENGAASGASANLFGKRTEASVQACRQRMAYCTLHPSMAAPWFDNKHRLLFEEDVRLSCRMWRRGVRLACADLLSLIRMTDGPEDFFWLMVGMATEGPIELYVSNYKFKEQVLGSRPFSASLTPLPWLSQNEIQKSRPHYLWDAREQKTVETFSMAPLPRYVAVSHTWGRWRIHSKSSLAIPGVPWLVPQNELWDVAEIPEQLRKIPGGYRYIWFDLVCIPQSPEGGSHLKTIEIAEIAKQASIFGNADHAVTWLNTVSIRELEHLQVSLLILSIKSGNFIVGHKTEWEELERLRPGSSKRYYEGKSGDTYRQSIPLVREDRRSLLGTTVDPAEYVNQWFTSLWTLQEVCMRPDMWLCANDWTPLRLFNNTPWHVHQNIGIDALVALLEDFRNDKLLQQPSFPDDEDWRTFDINAEVTPEIAEARAKAVRSGYMDVGGYDSSPQAVENAISKGKTQKLMKAMPYGLHVLNAMFAATGISHLLYTSPMDVLVLADRRECEMRRAEAIMSAIGAVSWYQDHHAEQDLVLNRYPLQFLEEIRTKVGNADFFQSRLLTKKAVRILEHFTATGSIPPAAGTMLPFGSHSTFEVTYTRDRLLSDPITKQSHPSLSSWQINPDGSVHMEHASILQCTRTPEHICDCLRMLLDEVGYYEHKSSGSTQSLQLYDGHPKDWTPQRDPQTNHCCYLVCLDVVETHDHVSIARIPRFSSHGLVLQELRPGTLVKIGSFLVGGCKDHVFPPSTKVDWTIL